MIGMRIDFNYISIGILAIGRLNEEGVVLNMLHLHQKQRPSWSKMGSYNTNTSCWAACGKAQSKNERRRLGSKKTKWRKDHMFRFRWGPTFWLLMARVGHFR